ncbi:acid phosphatase [Fulvivirga sp. M361]|uniref:metallophosphoesterase n=1 Tax=Fulvivirga sp. M361 TaxID=2594266 RepID=UPI001179C833|nr:metallophosphoesterase [Fulvivirga sp. M361]TRX58693.1 acid phosphatase [Fulvivirga sp. M361]
MKTTYFICLVVSFFMQCVPVEQEKQQQEKETLPALQVTEDALHFYVLGDWGRNGQFSQQKVADIMEKSAYVIEPEMILSTGDNFYDNGVGSTQDYNWISSYEQIYSGQYTHCPWYVVLGNHDYRGNIQAEIDYTHISRRWNMPDRYYTKDFKSDDGATATFVFIDTSPFEDDYYQEDKYKDVVAGQDTTAQIVWMDSVLSASKADWRIVVGHHPLYSGGQRLKKTANIQRHFDPIFKRNQVDLYFAGHEHDLQHIKPVDGMTHHIISGAGSEVRPTGMMQHSKFAKSVPGFVAASLTRDAILLQFVDVDGTVIYTFNIKKDSD